MTRPFIPDYLSDDYFALWHEQQRLNADSHDATIEARTYSRQSEQAAELSAREHFHDLAVKTVERELGIFLNASRIRARIMQSRRRASGDDAPQKPFTVGDMDTVAYHSANDGEHAISDYDATWNEEEDAITIRFSAQDSADGEHTCDDEADWLLGMLQHRAAGLWQAHDAWTTVVYTRNAVHYNVIFRRIDPEADTESLS